MLGKENRNDSEDRRRKKTERAGKQAGVVAGLREELVWEGKVWAERYRSPDTRSDALNDKKFCKMDFRVNKNKDHYQ